jgi:hypothetical protein
MAKPTKHVGFSGAVKQVQKKEGYSAQTAAKIIAAGARNASKAAHKANPRLNKVPGKSK